LRNVKNQVFKVFESLSVARRDVFDLLRDINSTNATNLREEGGKKSRVASRVHDQRNGVDM